MQVTTSLMAQWFDQINRTHFGGRLPRPTFATGRSRTRVGTMEMVCRRQMPLKVTRQYTIRLSNYYDMSEEEYKNVLAHEMIHLHIASSGIKDTSSHGQVFRSIMQRLNQQGLNITVSASRQHLEPAAQPTARRSPYVVMAIITKDGKRLLSVVSPRYVFEIDRILRNSTQVKTHSWHVTTDTFFANFPSVRTPKGRIVTPEVFTEKVAAMQPLLLDKIRCHTPADQV